MAIPSRPAALAAEFTLTSLDDVDAALHELGWCQHRIAAIDAETKAKVEALKTAQEALFALRLADEDVPSTTVHRRAEALETALQAWAEEHLQQHLARDSKTLKLAHGDLSLKLQPLAVTLGEGVNEKAVVAAIEKKSKLPSLVANLLKKITLGVFSLQQIIRLTPSLDKDGIKAVWEQFPKNRGTLKNLGINVTGGSDAIVVSPAKVKVSKAAA